MKKFCFLFICVCLFVVNSFAQTCTSQYLAVPNYSSNQVKLFYPNGNIYKNISVPVNLLSPPVGTNLGVNSVVIINSNLFVGVASNAGDFGGILKYSLAQVQNNQNPSILATPNNQAVIALGKDATSNLLVSTAAFGNNSGVICRYTAASTYAANSVKSLPITADMGWWVNAFGGIAVYNANTIFSTDVFGNAVICYHNINWNASPVSADVTVLKDVPGVTPYLFSLPEGIALDANNDLWISSNNDTYSTQLNPTGNLTHLAESMWQNHIAPGNPPVITIDGSLVGVERIDIWENGVNATLLGGIEANGSCLYINNQKNGASTSVLQFEIGTHAVSPTNFTQTYPGFGGISIFSNTPFNPTFTSMENSASISISDIKAFPNPIADVLNLTWTNDKGKEVTIRMFDYLGREVVNAQILKGTNTIFSLSSLPSGLYTLSLQVEGELPLNTKIVKE